MSLCVFSCMLTLTLPTYLTVINMYPMIFFTSRDISHLCSCRVLEYFILRITLTYHLYNFKIRCSWTKSLNKDDWNLQICAFGGFSLWQSLGLFYSEQFLMTIFRISCLSDSDTLSLEGGKIADEEMLARYSRKPGGGQGKSNMFRQALIIFACMHLHTGLFFFTNLCRLGLP